MHAVKDRRERERERESALRRFKKRAIQFGSRIAKQSNVQHTGSHSLGPDLCCVSFEGSFLVVEDFREVVNGFGAVWVRTVASFPSRGSCSSPHTPLGLGSKGPGEDSEPSIRKETGLLLLLLTTTTTTATSVHFTVTTTVTTTTT